MQLSQPQEGSSTPQPVDESQLYYQAVGGEKKKRLYGIGSSTSSYYPRSSSSTSSSIPRNAELELQIQQLQEELHQIRQQQQDERRAREEQQQEERRAREEQQQQERRAREEQTRDDVQRLFDEQMARWMRSNPRYPDNNDGTDNL